MNTRWDVERAVFLSDLAPQSRLMALTLLAMSNPKTCVIPAEYTPSLTRLEQMTGLSRRSVQRELNALETDGWVVRKRPAVEDARANKERTRYRLMIPKARATQTLAGPDYPDMARATGTPARATQTPELGPQGHRARATQTLIPDPSQTIDQTAARNGPERIVIEATGANAEEAAAIVRRIRNERDPKSMIGFLRRMAEDGDLAQHLTEHRAAIRKAEVEKAWSEIKHGPPCEHLMPGGAMPHPVTGEPVCLSCRRQTKWEAS